MHAIIEQHIEDLRDLCVRHSFQRLELFGSAASGEYEAGASDLDFLVIFPSDLTPIEHARAYFGLLEDLQDLFGCPIDLVEALAIRNPYLRESIELSRTLLYAA
ncbi:hypothetical protein FJZ36_13420 [Candidatus Poribacteria bacterium]|nr:hypothetical protein [Candidatus Poribacteria bacterium]